MTAKVKLRIRIEIVLIVITLISIFIAPFWIAYVSNASHEKEWGNEKRCFVELTKIVETSSKEKAEWIQNTILVQRSALSGPHYCRSLELVRGLKALNNSQKGD